MTERRHPKTIIQPAKSNKKINEQKNELESANNIFKNISILSEYLAVKIGEFFFRRFFGDLFHFN